VTTDPAALDRARKQAREIAARQPALEVVTRLAAYGQACCACAVRIEPGDEIGNALGAWSHIACAMCLECGTWLSRRAGEGRVCTGCGTRPDPA
jgi:hypothetical protein